MIRNTNKLVKTRFARNRQKTPKSRSLKGFKGYCNIKNHKMFKLNMNIIMKYLIMEVIKPCIEPDINDRTNNVQSLIYI